MIYDSLLIVLRRNSKNRKVDQITDKSYMSIDASYEEKKPVIHYVIIDHYFHCIPWTKFFQFYIYMVIFYNREE